MAFYAYDAARPFQRITTDAGKEPVRVDGVGAYYAYDSTHEAVQPINHLALSGDEQLADEAARALIGRRTPVLIARTWAKRATDLVWEDELGDGQLTLLPITDNELATVRRSAFGNALPMVAIVSSSPAPHEVAAQAFYGTPYELIDTYVIYSLTQAVPRGSYATPLYLFVGRLRDADDRMGGNKIMTIAATYLRGKLVYLVKLPFAKKPSGPGARFQDVLTARTTSAVRIAKATHGLSGGGFRAPGALGMSDATIGLFAVLGIVGTGYLLKRFAT